MDLLNPPAPNCLSETRTVTLTGANGDQITLALTGQTCFAGQPGTLTIGTAADSWVVTGGTGRFSGSDGQWHRHGAHRRRDLDGGHHLHGHAIHTRLAVGRLGAEAAGPHHPGCEGEEMTAVIHDTPASVSDGAAPAVHGRHRLVRRRATTTPFPRRVLAAGVLVLAVGGVAALALAPRAPTALIASSAVGPHAQRPGRGPA